MSARESTVLPLIATVLIAAVCVSAGAGTLRAQPADRDGGDRQAEVQPPDPRKQVNALTDEAIDARIRKHRTAETTLTVTDGDGNPLSNTEATVTMRRHKFLFGCNVYRWGGLKDKKLENAYRRRFAELLNFATLPFYWGGYERRRGKPDEARLRAMAEWCRRQGIRTKGHPLVWHEVPARWHEDLPLGELRRLQLARVEREIKAFAGLIDTWDVVNEAIVMPERPEPVGRLCKEMGNVKLIAAAFEVARKTHPKATLLLNDYIHDERFVQLIRRCLDAKVSLDVVGIQSHMHGGYMGPRKVWEACERFAQFGKPLHWTEATILSGRLKTWKRFDRVADWGSTPAGEKRQAAQAAEFYRVLFSHPSVEAITWWDFSDNGSWQSAPAGLVRTDMTPKPAYHELMKLIKGDWWTGPLTLTTDAAGRTEFRGFLGDYELRAAKTTGAFRLDKPGKAAATAQILPAGK